MTMTYLGLFEPVLTQYLSLIPLTSENLEIRDKIILL